LRVKKALTRTLVVLIVLLAAARVALPPIVKHTLNARLADMEGYRGHVDDVHLALWRARIALKDLVIRDAAKKDFELKIARLTLDSTWKDLLARRLVADITVFAPEITMAAPKPSTAVKKTAQKAKKAEKTVEEKTGKTLAQHLKEMLPFRVDSFELERGLVKIVPGSADEQEQRKRPDEKRQPDEPVELRAIRAGVHDLTNMSKKERATGFLDAELAGGTIALKLSAKPLAAQPTFDLAAEIHGVSLARLNPVLRWQWNVDVSSGTFDLVSETKAENGAFKGYVKPFIKELKVAPAKDAGLAKKVKQAVVKAVTEVLENKNTKEVATKVPFEGRFDDPKTDIWTAVASVLKNAFIKALSPSFEKL
jgi:hypothetical protein